MKRFIIILLCLFLCIGCTKTNEEKKENNVEKPVENVEDETFENDSMKMHVKTYRLESCSDLRLADILYVLEENGITHSLKFAYIDDDIKAILSIGINNSVAKVVLDYSRDDSVLEIVSGTLQKTDASKEKIAEKLCSYRPQKLTSLNGHFSTLSQTGLHTIYFYDDFTCKIENNLNYHYSNDFKDCKYSLKYESEYLSMKIYQLNVNVGIYCGYDYDTKREINDYVIRKLKFKLYTESYYKPIKLYTNDVDTFLYLQSYESHEGDNLVFDYSNNL